MAKITDYRTESQKRRDAKREKIFIRYQELRDEGLTHNRACTIAAQENDWTTQGVYSLVKRFEAQQTN